MIFYSTVKDVGVNIFAGKTKEAIKKTLITL
jgi:hypothetical protein